MILNFKKNPYFASELLQSNKKNLICKKLQFFLFVVPKEFKLTKKGLVERRVGGGN